MSLLAATSAGGGAGDTTPAIDTTGATLLVAIGVADSSSATPTLTDSKSNVWTELPLRGGGNPTFHEDRIFYVEDPVVGTGHTFTVAGTNAAVCVAAFDGTTTPTSFDQETGAVTLASESAPGGSLTPPAPGLFISAIGIEQLRTFSIGSGFTIAVDQPHAGGESYGCALAYKETSGAENPTWSWTGQGNGDVVVSNATFDLPAAGPTLVPFRTTIGAQRLTY